MFFDLNSGLAAPQYISYTLLWRQQMYYIRDLGAYHTQVSLNILKKF